jgi:hypothetical protein
MTAPDDLINIQPDFIENEDDYELNVKNQTDGNNKNNLSNEGEGEASKRTYTCQEEDCGKTFPD